MPDDFSFSLIGNGHNGAYTGRHMWSDRAVMNALSARIDQLRQMLFDPRRNLEDECGYPRLDESLNVEMFRQLYDRDAIANRVVSLLPKESWQVQPLVYEKEEGDEATDFEKAWDALGKQLTSEGSSYYKDEEGSPVWEYLSLVDILSGIGHFGILLIGIDDNKNLMEPIDGVEIVTNVEVKKRTHTYKGNERRTKGHHVRNQYAVAWPDSPMTTGEESALTTNTKQPLTDDESRAVEVWKQERGNYKSLLRNALKKDKPDRGINLDPKEPSFTKAKTVDGKEVYGTDAQYDQSIYGAGQVSPPTSPNSSSGENSGLGTDQQYFGVQYGPSEEIGDDPSTDKGERKLIFLRAFDESLVQVVRWEWNIRNPRFGQPVMYRITLNDPRVQHSGVGLPMATVFVHWSRVLHVNDTNLNAVSSRVMAMPRCQPVLNNLLGLRKLYMAGPEGYYKACLAILKFVTHPQLGGDVEVNTDQLRDDAEQMMNGLQRVAIGRGGDWGTVAPTVTDPASQIDKQLEAICIQLGCPVRVFKGSERGELASSQDDASWNDRLKQRQLHYITPRIIVPFIDRLIGIGVLPVPSSKGRDTSKLGQGLVTPPPAPPANGSPTSPTPFKGSTNGSPKSARATVTNRDSEASDSDSGEEDAGQEDGSKDDQGVQKGGGQAGKGSGGVKDDEPVGYCIEWPDLDSMTDKDKAGILLQRTQAWAAYVQGNLESVIPPHEYATKFDQMTEEESEAMLESAQQAHEAMDTMTQPPMIQGQPAAPAKGTAEEQQQKQQQEDMKQQQKLQEKALATKGPPGMGGAGGGKPAGIGVGTKPLFGKGAKP